jgi:DNA gyrase subunit B
MSQYKAEDIQVLEGIEAVRKRPGMYIGGTGKEGLHHLIWEVVANSVDESLAGYCKNIDVVIENNNRIKVSDDGRGIPVDIHPKTKKSALETVLTYLHAGGKFSDKVYKVSGGLHGVGISVVNALSKYLKAIVYRDGFEWVQEYERGVPKYPVKKLKPSKKNGTTIIFEPDNKIFEKIEFDRDLILDYLRHQAYLTPKLRINFFDKRKDSDFYYSFYFEGGIKSFLQHILKNKKLVNNHSIYLEYEGEEKKFEIAFNYTELPETKELAFTNNILNPEGGTHLIGARNALVRVFNDFAKELNLLKNNKNLISEDIRGGLYLIISLKMKDPQFEGQTKAKLGNPEVRSFVENNLFNLLKEYFGKNPEEVKNILQRLLINLEAREAEKSAKEAVFKKRISISTALSGKLADCSSKDFSKRELFIVEGDSAGGSAKQGRNRIFQAILPLRGKILNVEKANLTKMLKSKEIKDLIIALGVIVISGLAYGIDSCAHKSVINSKGKTIAIIGEGIITALKSTKRKLIEEIIQNDGLVISEFSNETKAMPYHFPLRNRLIAALSDGVVIVEAPIDSGALITAKYALKYNKEIFVVPGEITNKNFEGSHNLIKQGAKLITKVEDILVEFNFKLPEKIIKTEKLTAEEEMVVEILNKKPMTIEEISRTSKKSIEDLLVILTYMEIKGLVKNYNGKFYVTQLN